MIKSSQSLSAEDESRHQYLASPSGPQVSLRNTFGDNKPDSHVCSFNSEAYSKIESNFQISEQLQSIQLNTEPQINLQKTYRQLNPLQKLHQLAAKNRLVKQFKQNLLMSSYVLSKDYKDKIISFEGFYQNRNKSLNSVTREQNSFLPVFEAFGNPMKIWDIIMMLQYLIQLWFLPFLISFYRFEMNLVFLKEVIIGLIMLNLVIQMNRQIIYKGKYIFNRQKIIKIYLKTGILGDVIQITTWICFMYFDKSLYNIIYMMVLGFFLMLVCVQRLQKITEYYMDSFYNKGNLSNMLDLMILILQIYYVAHYMACIWHLVGDISQQILDVSWLTIHGFSDEPIIIKYNYSFYWASMTMTTVGYGDITGGNSYEVLASNVLMFFSSCIFAYSMNSIGNILKSINDNKLYLRRKISSINTYMQKNQVDLRIQSKVRNYIKYINQSEQQDNINDSKNILNQLPKGLKREMNEDVAQKIIQKIKLLSSNFSQRTLKSLTEHLSIVTYAPGEYIYHQNEPMEFLYFINSGEVQFNEENSSAQLNKLKSNQTFNEFSFFTSNPTKCSATSVGFSQIVKIKRSIFLKIIQECQKDIEKFQHIKDTMSLYNDYSLLQKKCYYCGKINHETIDCPLLTYQPDKNNCIRRYHISNKKQQNRKFVQRHYHYIPARMRYQEIKNTVLQYKEQIGDQFQSEINIKQENNIQDAASAEKLIQIDMEQLVLVKPKTSPIPETNLRRPSNFAIPQFSTLEQKSVQKSQLDYFFPQYTDFQIDQYCDYDNYMIHNNPSNILKNFQIFKRKTKKNSARKIYVKDTIIKKGTQFGIKDS